MTDEQMRNTELVSALVDGQLRGAEFAEALAHLDASSEARQSWHAYHVMGDVMRTGQLAVSTQDADFVVRLRARLQQEAVPLTLPSERDWRTDGAVPSSSQARHVPPVPSANDNAWRLVVGLASVAVVVVMAWEGFQGYDSKSPQLAIATVTAPVTASPLPHSMAPATALGDLSTPQLKASADKRELAMSTPPIMIRDPQLDAFLAAHRQFGGTSALQMPTGFLRNATFEEGVR